MISVRQSGVTMVELMIAMTVGLLLVGGALTIYVQAKQSYAMNDKILTMQDDARYALLELTRDIAATGFWGELGDPGSVTADTSLTIDEDCGSPGTPWVYDIPAQITTLDNASAAAATAQFECIDADVFQDGTDIVAIKRTAGGQSAALVPGNVYLRSNGIVGLLFEHPQAVPPAIAVPAPAANWSYTPSVWYVRNHASEFDVSDGIPTLCRKFLATDGNPSMVEECLARGIEDLQLEFGLDTDGDGAADRYIASPAAGAMNQLVTIRVFLLARSARPHPGYRNDKSYRLSNRPALTPDDSFYRRVYTATVSARNLRNQARFGP